MTLDIGIEFFSKNVTCIRVLLFLLDSSVNFDEAIFAGTSQCHGASSSEIEDNLYCHL